MSFHVAPVEGKHAFNDAYVQTLLKKWDMSKNSFFHIIRYTKYYHKMQGQELLLDMFNSETVRPLLRVLKKSGEWSLLPADEPITAVVLEAVPATLTRMDLFDKLQEADPPIVRPNGDLVKCMDDQREGFQISDMLRQMLLCDSCEQYELYSDEEKSELLWRLFEHLALGGACCQFEDNVQSYMDVAKRIYKELVSVQKNSSGAIEVTSVVYKVTALETASGERLQLFPSPGSRNNFLYVAVDPLRRVARIWYHAMLPFW
uniref:Cilia- and flagella-associated protein 300 n=1 Tax=Chlamydomonas euryale TaxID=1486919 RepID=A0A7R9Z2Y3_9CHLO|mmetsp:Transcript_43127/g.129498  ORF Transcript_43127/g.129498 Transcript_43127/m.129498 type:complete len:260 (+) Transcript_43127:114-893(+)